MADKIIQIIPAPPDMWAIWEPTEKGEKTEYSPVVCLALHQGEEGGTWVTPMVMFGDG